jgi:hypothetical protein
MRPGNAVTPSQLRGAAMRKANENDKRNILQRSVRNFSPYGSTVSNDI